MSSNRRFRLKDGSIPRALTLPAPEDRHKPFDHTQGSPQPRPQYEKHLRGFTTDSLESGWSIFLLLWHLDRWA